MNLPKVFNRNKNPTTQNQKTNQDDGSILKMITLYNEHFYNWNGKMYESDIVRACLRPKIQAIGKLVGKHIRDDPNKGLIVNPDARIRFLLSEPNPYMTGQQMQEKVATQLCLNNNAFILKIYDFNGIVVQLYPIPCVQAEAIYDKQGTLFLKFQYRNGNFATFPYDDIIHLKRDYNDNDIFGSSQADAIATMMNAVGTIDQGLINAIKNSAIIQWLMVFKTSMRPEDIKKNVDDFVKNYLDIQNENFGAAGVDSKADIQRIEPKDYVPNAAITDRIIDRLYSFFNTNKKIVHSEYSEDEWNAYYEAEIEREVIQLSNAYTIGLFSRKERGYNNRIVFEANNLQCASIKTKLELLAMVDRGAMTPNEWRATMNLAPLPGGDEPIRRLDTQVVNMAGQILSNADPTDYKSAIAAALILLQQKGGELSGAN